MRNLDPRRQRWIKARLGMLVTLIGGGFVALSARAHELQVRQGPALRELAEQQYEREIHMQPRRGTIYDRHHNALAVTVDVPSLLANPRALRRRNVDVANLAARLATATSIPVADLLEKLRADSAYRWLKHYLTTEEAAAVRVVLRELHLREGDGVELPMEPRRWYPNRELAAHVLGFVGTEGQGVEGIERSMDTHLYGRRVSMRGVRDAMGRLVFAENLTPGDGQAGSDVTLTIDKTVQYIAERELAAMVRSSEARGGSVIVTDPRTGELLAMASYPTFNPNDYQHSDADARRNRALADRFEPGSTMKVFTVAGALDAGVINAGQQINCYGGTYTIGDLTIHDSHIETWLTPMQVLARSSNIGAAQIGAALGPDGLERVFRRFGFGERTGLPMPAEARARFGERRWYDVEVATVSFGQGIGVTSMQLAQGLGAVANGGRMLHPLLVSRIHDATGSLVEEHVPDAGRMAIDPRVSRLVAEMLTAVTEEGGTGTGAAIPGVRVAGKTGTAQKAREHGRGYDSTRWVSSFIGFAPADRPAVLVTVIIDEPAGEHSGGVVAAPVFRRVAEETLRYLGRLPSSGSAPTPRVMSATERSVARAEGAALTTAGETSFAQIVSDGGVSATQTPSVLGMSARRAVQSLGSSGLEAIVMGTGTVVRQTPAPGEAFASDRRVRIELEPGGGAPAPLSQTVNDADSGVTR